MAGVALSMFRSMVSAHDNACLLACYITASLIAEFLMILGQHKFILLYSNVLYYDFLPSGRSIIYYDLTNPAFNCLSRSPKTLHSSSYSDHQFPKFLL